MEQLALSGVGAPLQAVTDFVFVPDCIFRADVILIPGGSRPELAWRATELFKAGAGRFVLPSGGPNKRIPEYPSEWAFLREILIERACPNIPSCAKIGRRTLLTTPTFRGSRFNHSYPGLQAPFWSQKPIILAALC